MTVTNRSYRCCSWLRIVAHGSILLWLTRPLLSFLTPMTLPTWLISYCSFTYCLSRRALPTDPIVPIVLPWYLLALLCTTLLCTVLIVFLIVLLLIVSTNHYNYIYLSLLIVVLEFCLCRSSTSNRLLCSSISLKPRSEAQIVLAFDLDDFNHAVTWFAVVTVC